MSYEFMRKLIGELGDQLDWAAQLQPHDDIAPQSEGLVCGMGGSGIGGDYASAWAELSGGRVSVNKNYGLPSWAAAASPLVVAVSYSGNTEETLSAVAAARAHDLSLVAITSGGTLAERARGFGFPLVTVPGGLPPRAALGFLVGAVLQVLHWSGVTKDPVPALSEAADVARRLSGPGGSAESQAQQIADELSHRLAVVYGAVGPTAMVAQRWKTQINENSKQPAYWSVLPELDHNEIVGWSARPEIGQRVGIVALRDNQFEGGSDAEHGALAARFQISEQVTSDMVDWVATVEADGTDPLARMISLTAVGDLVSLYLAQLSDTDPTPVDTIEAFKATLSRRLSQPRQP